MIRSMTGYGRGEAQGAGKQTTVEMKGVNHRFLEIVVRMPKQFSALEERLRKIIQEQVSRGRVDVFISVEEFGDKAKNVKVDKNLAQAYYSALKELEEHLGSKEVVDYTTIPRFPDVLVVEEDEADLEEVWTTLATAVTQATGQFIEMRQIEGTKLAQDILHRVDSIANLNGQIEQRSPLVVEEYRQKLDQRLKTLLPELELDPGRIATEVAIFADRSSITEENVRLNSHLEQMRQNFQQGGSVGRKLDFIVQEMNRETNTIGSKANDLQITSMVVEVKSEIEKIREQVQNIE